MHPTRQTDMATVYFIADIHAGIHNPRRTALLLAFCDLAIAERADLYILGDLFDFWANNRLLRRAHRDIFGKFGAMAGRGIRVGVLAGNRDFLLSHKTLAACGARFLGEEAEIALDGRRLFLAHGHTLCRADTRFLAYRKRMWPVFRMLDRFLPGFVENRIAQRFMEQSKKVISRQDPARFEFTREAIADLFRAGIHTVICGHTHNPEHFQINGCRFFALPAWDDGTGHYLRYSEGVFSLHAFTHAGCEHTDGRRQETEAGS